MAEQNLSKEAQVGIPPELTIDSPYPREIVLPPLFAPWPQRVGADLVALALGWSIGGVHPSHPHAVELNLASAVLGLMWARWLYRRALGVPWRSIAFGVAGIVVGRVFLPPKLPDLASNHIERVFATTFLFYFVAVGVAAITWAYHKRRASVQPSGLDGYEAFRASVGRLGLYPLPLIVVLLVLPRESSPVLPVLVSVTLMIFIDVYHSYRRAVTRAAVWATCWTPILLALLAYSPMSAWYPLRGAELVLVGGLGLGALFGSIFLPVSQEGRVPLSNQFR